MLALDRSQSTHDITNSSFPGRLYLEGMQGELCNVGTNSRARIPCAFVSGLNSSLVATVFFIIHRESATAALHKCVRSLSRV